MGIAITVFPYNEVTHRQQFIAELLEMLIASNGIDLELAHGLVMGSG